LKLLGQRLKRLLRVTSVVHVVDASHPDPAWAKFATVRDVIGEVVPGYPELIVFNKIDLVDETTQAGTAWSSLRAELDVKCCYRVLLKLVARISRRLPEPDFLD
jgi:GTP-binding protein HflX